MSALAPQAQFPTFKFENPGNKIHGVISQPTEDRQAREFGKETLKFWPDGKPVMQTRVILRVSDGTEWAVYAQGRMAKAITKAIVAAGADDLEVGGVLEVMFSDYGEGKNPAMPPKEYEATYVKPSSAVVVAADPWTDGPSDEPPW